MPEHFERLCADFSRLLREPAPDLDLHADGLQAFHVTWREVVVDIIHKPSSSSEHAFVLFQLGPMPEEAPNRADLLSALLQANFLSLRVNAPTFSCHPETQEAVLQCVFPLIGAKATDLYQLIDEGVTLALEWRESHFLVSSPTSEDAARSVPHTFA